MGTDAAQPAVRRRVLVVDDEADILELLELTLSRMGLDVERASSVAGARQQLQKSSVQLCLTDMRLPDGTGLELVNHIGQHYPALPVAVITAFGSADNAVAALKAGAFDYLAKPVALEQLRALVRAALQLPGSLPVCDGDACPLLGRSAAMEQARALIGKLSRSQAPVYITGESGSGKELAARMIHGNGARGSKPFVAVNCGAIPENLMESEFFGYKKGAFTGAEHDRDGFFQASEGGTLFLDEVADLPMAMQVKLLRAIQEKKVRKVGATQEGPVDVRIISATHQNLAGCVAAGRFRQDLYYRLNVIELRMPALREMREDIPVIARSLLQRLAAQTGHAVPELASEALEALGNYPFPGNVRELENVLERALALSGGGRIEREELHLAPVQPAQDEPSAVEGEAHPSSLPDYLDQVEKAAILDALEKSRYNKTAAAKLLGISFRAMRYRMERLGIL